MFMDKKNINRWEPTKLQIDNIILPAYTDLSKRCVSYINELECPPQYICLLYTSDAADEEDSVDLGGRRIIKKNNIMSKKIIYIPIKVVPYIFVSIAAITIAATTNIII